MGYAQPAVKRGNIVFAVSSWKIHNAVFVRHNF